MKNFKNGALIAIAAGTLFGAACKKADKAKDPPAQPEPAKAEAPVEAKPAETQPAAVDPAKPAVENPEKTAASVDCSGVNACKGQGSCKTDKHGCGGQNECKGQGVMKMTEEDCKAKGGTVASK